MYRFISLISKGIASSDWTAPNGTFTQGPNSFYEAPVFFRAVYSAWNATVHNQSGPNPDIDKFIHDYVNIQVIC